MRVTAMVAGVAVILAACGGGEKSGAAVDSTATAAAPAATSGTTHVVDMVMEGTAYKFVPADLTIKTGDMVVFKGISGAAHNVVFWADSIPAGAEAVLTAAMPGGTQPMGTRMIVDGDSEVVSFAGAPAGLYKMYCVPHLAMGMKGSITVTP
jgi:plastocyanin